MSVNVDEIEVVPKLVEPHPSDFRTQSFKLQTLKKEIETDNTGTSEVFEKEYAKYPTELQKTLLDFVVAYILEQPNDMIDYAVSHFTKLQRKRKANILRGHLEQRYEKRYYSSSSSSLQLEVKKPDSRRSSVFSETFGDSSYDSSEDSIIIPKTDKQRARLLEAIKDSIIFNSLQLEKMYEVVDSMYEKNVFAGDIIIREGEEGDNFYIIENGVFDIYRGAEHVNILSKGTFGEMALLYNVVRTATVQAMTNGKLWVMNRQKFRKILHTHEMEKQERYKMLIKDVALLHNLNKYEQIRIIDAFETMYFPKGQLILKQDDEAKGMYFIERGSVGVYVDNNDNQGNIIINKLRKSEYFGHLPLLIKGTYNSSVYADTDVKCVFISTENVYLYMKKCFPEMINSILYDFNVALDDDTIYKLRAMQSKIDFGMVGA